MAQPNPPDTPQEIIDEIIDHCSGDRSTLVACSLTSRAWVYRTRKHLFSELTLTSETLPKWCAVVTTPTSSVGLKERSFLDPAFPASSSYTSSWLSSYVTTLKIVSTHFTNPSKKLGSQELFQAQAHLFAFNRVKSLTLAAISFIVFDDASLEACLGALAATVRQLKLSFCYLDHEAFLAFLRLFAHLDLLELQDNVWIHNQPEMSQKDPPTLRGSLTLSGFAGTNGGLCMLDCLATARMEYNTITLSDNRRSVVHKFNILFTECKDHFETLILTAPESGPVFGDDRQKLSLDLSPCEKLVEINGRFHHAQFEPFISTLKTVKSPRFRKLSILITPPIPAIIPGEWDKMDAAIIALVKRVSATAASDMLEVLFSSYSTGLGGVQLSEIPGALPLTASDARVSLRTKYLPVPLNP